MLARWHGRVFSQFGADGILHKIFEDIGTTSRWYVEFGTQDNAVECNTRHLRAECGWDGLLMDGGSSMPAINLHQEFITAENILTLFNKYKVPRNLDLLSIDIDGNDWHVMHSILRAKLWRPRVIVVESALILGCCRDWVSTYDPAHKWDGSCYGSASPMAFFNLARRFQYTLVAVASPDLYFIHDSVLRRAGKPPYQASNNVTALLEAGEGILNHLYEVGFGLKRGANNADFLAKSLSECLSTWERRGYTSSLDSTTRRRSPRG